MGGSAHGCAVGLRMRRVRSLDGESAADDPMEYAAHGGWTALLRLGRGLQPNRCIMATPGTPIQWEIFGPTALTDSTGEAVCDKGSA